MNSNHRSSSYSLVYEMPKKQDDLKYCQYEKGRLLGQGGFASCFKSKRLFDQKSFAMKIIKLTDKKQQKPQKSKNSKHPRLSTEEKVLSEAKLLRMCQHQNIVKYETDFIYDNQFYIIMQYCDKGVLFILYESVSDMLKNRGTLTESEARYFIAQMIQGLKYLKSRKIIHRDLKPANYLLTSNLELKIADFGLATEVRHSAPYYKNICGTPNYISPQMLERRDYSYEVDLWSIGVILYSMLYGVAPFETKKKDSRQTYEKIKKCDYTLSCETVSNEANDLISKILVKDPFQRISLDDIMRHSFMTNFKIPKTLPFILLKENPSHQFIDAHQRQKLEKQESFHSKIEIFKDQSEIKQFDAVEYQLEKSYSKTSQSEAKLHSLKRSLQRLRNQFKEISITQNKPKTLLKPFKRIQKQEMMTSSPGSWQQLKILSQQYHQNKSNCIQSPSTIHKLQTKISIYNEDKQKQAELIQKESATKKHKFHENNLNQKDQILLQFPEQQKNFRNEVIGQNILPQSSTQFPSLRHLLKKIDFQEIQNHPLYKNALNWSPKSLILAKNQVQNLSKIYLGNQVRKQCQQKQAVIPFKNINNKNVQTTIYSVQDFVCFVDSLHLKNHKAVKLIYCLKEQTSFIQGKNPQNAHSFKSFSSRIIGSVYFDNSSIITKIYHQNSKLFQSSIYVKNVECILDRKIINVRSSLNPFLAKKDFEIQTDEGKVFELKIDLCNCQLSSSKTHQINKMTELDFDLQLKIHYAKDSIRSFRNILIKMKPSTLTTSKDSQMPVIEVNYANEMKHDFELSKQFRYIKMFLKKGINSTFYFELNDGLKVLLSKENNLKVQNLFQNQQMPQIYIYSTIIYDPKNRIAFIKSPDDEYFRPLFTRESQNLRKQNADFFQMEGRSISKNFIDTFQQNYSDFDDKIEKKIKLNQNQRSFKNSETFKIPTITNFAQTVSQKKRVESASDLMKKLSTNYCLKLNIAYLTERDKMRQKHQNIHNQQVTPQQNFQNTNKNDDIEFQNGRLWFKLRKDNSNFLTKLKIQKLATPNDYR